MIIEWVEDLAIGESEIDNQHKEIIRLMNRLGNALSQGLGHHEISKAIGFLDDYIMIHFSYEENQMRIHNYSGYRLHKEKHGDFINQYQDFKMRLIRHGPTPSLVAQTLDFIYNWFVAHMAQMDLKLAVCYQANPPKNDNGKINWGSLLMDRDDNAAGPVDFLPGDLWDKGDT